jgi:hypothetical protein
MMDRQAIAQELGQLGRSDKKLLAKLEANRARRCELLTQVGRSASSGLEIGTMASVEPKDDD